MHTVRLTALSLTVLFAVACSDDSSGADSNDTSTAEADPSDTAPDSRADSDAAVDSRTDSLDASTDDDQGLIDSPTDLASEDSDGYNPDAEPDLPDDVSDVIPVTSFSADGPWPIARDYSVGPNQAFSMFWPQELGADGYRHPVLTWGNGTNAQPWHYVGLLEHLASHGFIVIASNSVNTGAGNEMIEGVDWVLAENEREDSEFFGVVNPDTIGSLGHSQGGAGAINSGVDPRISATVPIEPAPGRTLEQHAPMFLVGGSADFVVNPTTLITPLIYNISPVPTFFGVLDGANHTTPGNNAGGMRGPITAWLRLHLMADESAIDVFYGDDCGLCVDEDWEVFRRNWE